MRAIPAVNQKLCTEEILLTFNSKSSDHNAKPILVFDLLALPNVIVKNEIDMLYGGRHQKYYNQVDQVFRELSEFADLVFIKDGPLKKKKSDRTFGALAK